MNKHGRIDSYITFGGQCARAAKFYGALWGVEPKIMYAKEAPVPMEGMDPEHVMHASLSFDDGTSLLMSDGQGEQEFSARDISLSWTSTNHDKVMNVWQNFLDAGAKVLMPLGPEFFAIQIGMLQDHFGVKWMIIEAEEGWRAD